MAVSQATVFGGSGFVGRHVVKRLAAAGARVVVGVRHPERAGFLKPMGDVGQVVPVAADIARPAGVEAAVAGSGLVVNLAGILFESGRQRFTAVHEEGAGRVARAAAAAGAARLVHVSALGAAADSPAAYGRTKAAGEAAVRAAFPQAAIVRPGLVFGPEDGFFARFAALARLSPVLPLVGGGRTRFQPLLVADLAEAIVRVAERRDAADRVWELGGPRVYTFRELLEFVLAATGRRALLVPVPEAPMALKAWFLEFLPRPPLTRDQLAMLRRDNVAGGGAGIGTFADLGIDPAPLEAALPAAPARPAPRRR